MRTEWDYTSLAASYLKRPGYAQDAIEEMLRAMRLPEGASVCDVGAGAGHLTIPLAERRFQVTAVEPNDAMRGIGVERTGAFPHVHWRVGTGEDTGLRASEFDLVIFGSSFNVTDRARALRESARVLRPGGWFACLWNHRDLSDPLQAAIERIIRSEIENYDYGTRRGDQTGVISESGLFGAVRTVEGRFTHRQSAAECLEAWRSHATLRRQAVDRWDAILTKIARVLNSKGKEEIQIPYLTKIWFARKKELPMFGTKAETLEQLAPRLTTAKVLPQVCFTAAQWQKSCGDLLGSLFENGWAKRPLIVRSSALAEDREGHSNAGRFVSISRVEGPEAVEEAVSKVIASFNGSGADQIFIQPYLTNVSVSGVALSRDPNTGGPYFVINFDDESGTTDTVTSGKSGGSKVFYFHKFSNKEAPGPLSQVVKLLRELEALLKEDALDAEFAVTKDGELYLLQVRPLEVRAKARVSDERQTEALGQIHRKILESSRPHPYLYGSRTVYGVMPDWNPAEMIGIRPRPLALSLYKDLITDNIWAYQRDNYGYRNLRSFPLLVSFHGLPYIDVRVSFNSFIPADLEPGIARRLIDYYIDRLIENPSHHDKVEFDILYSCYTLDLPRRLGVLSRHGFSQGDRRALSQSLRSLTSRIIHNRSGLWRKDIEKIGELGIRRATIFESDLNAVSKVYWLLEDCKRYGTLPFAGLARAAFIAVQLLKSLVGVGVFSASDYENFMGSLDTIGSRLGRDLGGLGRREFLERYGHLRPGTYDILSARYDEEPERYFDWSRPAVLPRESKNFAPSEDVLKKTATLLKKHGLDYDAASFFGFIRQAIEGREEAKFIFSRSVSDALSILKSFAAGHGLSTDETSFIDVGLIQKLYASSEDAGEILRRSVEDGRRRFDRTRSISLPALLFEADQVWSFELPPTEPNFVTQNSAVGETAFVERDPKEALKGKILFLTSADPGYDWIFAHGIAGFITMYGGANSHMAVRAAELGVPAVIGAGETFYSAWSKAERLRIDCANRQVQVLS